jgi:hypothetical protein
MSGRLQPVLNELETEVLSRLVGIMLPASADYGVPSANDPKIFADILNSIGQDQNAVKRAVAGLIEQVNNFISLDDTSAEIAALSYTDAGGPDLLVLGRCILQCYYRDDRVLEGVGLTPRPPFPIGHKLEDGDFNLLNEVRNRPRMWRDIDWAGADS